MIRCSPYLAFLLLWIVLPTTGCLLRTRPVEDQYSKSPLKEATQQALIESINQQASAIHTLKATVDIDSSTGGIKKGTQTQYKEIRGFVLARKPEGLHMQGLMPFVRTLAFDMVSDGQDFKLWIPLKNKFVIGQNQVTVPNSEPMENVRPQNIYEALLIKQFDPATETAVLENGYQTLRDAKGHRILQEDYILTVITGSGSSGRLLRKIIFDRTDLKPHEQVIYREDGKIATDAKYAAYKDYGTVNFPSRIEIYRPHEEVDITMNMLKVEINTPLRDEQFILVQPEGAQVINLNRQ